MNIPTVCPGPVEMDQVGYVKKWDNGGRSRTGGGGLPKLAFWDGWFSKTGQELKSKSVKRWKRYPLFKRQRLLLLVFLLFYLVS
jgi:hypothetical protein